MLAWPEAAIQERCATLIQAVGLEHRAAAWPAELSGGEMQRVAASGRAVLALLAELTEREGSALVMVTHSEAAAGICHRVLRMEDGQFLGGPA